MFYRLKPEYALRGWEGMAWVLVQRPENLTRTLSQKQFHALLLCDGETPLSKDLTDSTIWQALCQCQENGWVCSSETAVPLDPSQYYRYYHNRFVQRAFWSVTGRCNFRCRHCYMDAPDAALGELTADEAFRLIDEMAECGILRVDITGGEPLVRRDFWQLVDRILSHGMTIGQLYSNGWLLDETVLDQFERRGLKPEFAISFDGVGGWHDWMRGKTGAEQATLRAMKLCSERGFHVSASMCIHRGNVHTLPQTVQALKAVGVEELKVSHVDQTDLWRCHSEGNEMTWMEYLNAVLPYIDWYYRTGRPIRSLELGGIVLMQQDAPGQLSVRHYDGTEKCLDNYLCGAVRWSCYITPEGRLLPCMPMTSSPHQDQFPKVQDIGLRRGLSDSFFMQFVNSRIKDLLSVNQECAACDYRYKCGGGCRAIALNEGDQCLMGCDRSMCAFWKSDAFERIQQALDKAEAAYGPA